MRLFHLRYFKSLIVITVIIIIAVMAVMEINIMQTASNISNLDSKINYLDSWITRFNIISIVGLTITLIAGAILILLNINSTKYRNQKDRILNMKIATLDSSTTETKNELVQSQRELEKEKIKRLALEKSLENRFIDPKVIPEIIKKLSPFKGQKIQLAWFTNSNDATNLATQINGILLSAGWMLFEAPTMRPTGTLWSGICLSALNMKKPPLIALKKALSKTLPDVSLCSKFGGLLPFAKFSDNKGNIVKASDISPNDIIILWIGLKAEIKSK